MAIVIRLTDDEREELERRRAAGGFRSLNETVKAWLATPEPAIISQHAEIERITEGVEFVKDAKSVRAEILTAAIQLGPTSSAPGSRLKKR